MRQNLVCLAIAVLVGSACRGPRDYVDKGNRLFDAGKYEDASIQYRKAIQKDNKLGDAYYRLGLSEVRRQRLADSYQALTRAVELMPGNDQAKIKLADVCLSAYLLDRQNKVLYNQVLKLSDELLAKNWNSFDALRLRGLLALSDKKPREATGYLERANGVRPADRDVVLGLTQSLIADNQFIAGEKLALEFIHKDKTFAPIYDVLYIQYLGANRTQDAEAILRTKVENNPKQANYVLQLAEHYARVEKTVEMTSTLRRLSDNRKDFSQAPLMVGDFYARLGRWDDAKREFEEGAQSLPKDKIRFQKRIMNALQAQGKTDETMQMVTLVLKADPKDEEARVMHATLLLESRKAESLDAALSEFQTLVQERQDDPVLRFNLGRSHLLKNNLDAARTQFQEAIRRRNDYLAARIALVVATLNQRKFQDALVYAKELLSLDPSNVQSRYLYAAALAEASHYDESRAQLERLLKQYPENRDVQMQLGLVAIAQKRFKEAETIFARLHTGKAEDLRPAIGLVEVYSSESQFDKAIQLLNDDLKKSPNSTSTRELLASTAVRAGKYDLAIPEYQKLLSQAPKSVDLRMRLADVYRRKGDLTSAITMLEQTTQMEPKNTIAATYLAAVLAQSGRLAEAKKSYRRLIELRPDDPEALNDLAFVLEETGDNLEEALGLAQRALQKTPNQPNFQDTLGCIYLRKRMHDSAIQAFTTIVRQQPNNPTFRYHLGWALLEKGDKVRAKDELENALANQPSQQEEAKIKELIRKIG